MAPSDYLQGQCKDCSSGHVYFKGGDKNNTTTPPKTCNWLQHAFSSYYYILSKIISNATYSFKENFKLQTYF
jgi:hypothetical protein